MNRKSRILIALAKHHSSNKTEDRQTYPQTWWIVSQFPKWLKTFTQWICGKTGHELSNTEWGYGGGDVADCWCRWCNKLVEVPKTSVYFSHSDSKELMKMVDKANQQSREE